jgi:protein SCO1/2
MSKINYVLVALVFLVLSCAEGKKQGKSGLPFLGHHEINAEHPEDTIYHTVPSFAFENQDGKVITNEAVKGKIYVANFFFTSCPTICPKMTSQLKRLQSMTKEEGIVILSHSVDPIRDSVARLKKYAIDNGLDTKNWHLMTGDADDLGMEGYNLSAMEDGSAPGGFLHSEMVVLVDKEGHLRGMYEGTNTEAMDRLVADIKKLKTEYE